MSREMSAAELVIMAAAISAALAVMIAVVFLAEYRSNNPRPRSSERAPRPPGVRRISGGRGTLDVVRGPDERRSVP